MRFNPKTFPSECANLELDQRLRIAFERAGANRHGNYSDVGILAALLRLNPTMVQHLGLGATVHSVVADFIDKHAAGASDREPMGMERSLERILKNAAKNHRDAHTLGVQDFLIALIEDGIALGEEYSQRPFSIDLFVFLGGEHHQAPLSRTSSALSLLSRLKSSPVGADDFQYILALEGERLVFRSTSVLGDYVQASDSGLLLPQRAILTHLRENLGLITVDEIAELEDLLNSRSAKEKDFQDFFERNSHFFRKWDYREVHSRVYLARDEGPLIPDFILTDREAQKAAILELKLPAPQLIRRQRNRDRFAAAITEARAQLLHYRDWFKDPRNRRSLVGSIGMEIYEPHLAVVIGRSGEFEDEFDRQLLASHASDIEIVTYEDLLAYAKRRQIIIQ